MSSMSILGTPKIDKKLTFILNMSLKSFIILLNTFFLVLYLSLLTFFQTLVA